MHLLGRWRSFLVIKSNLGDFFGLTSNWMALLCLVCIESVGSAHQAIAAFNSWNDCLIRLYLVGVRSITILRRPLPPPSLYLAKWYYLIWLVKLYDLFFCSYPQGVIIFFSYYYPSNWVIFYYELLIPLVRAALFPFVLSIFLLFINFRFSLILSRKRCGYSR